VDCDGRRCGVGGTLNPVGGQDWHVTNTNRTHRTRLARALASAAGIPYQAALSRVLRS